jgi:hypothetical protein
MKYSLTWFKGEIIDNGVGKVKRESSLIRIADMFIPSRQVEEIQGVQMTTGNQKQECGSPF